MSTIPTIGFDFDLTLADTRASIDDALNYAISFDAQAEQNQRNIPLGSFTLDQIMNNLRIVDTLAFRKRFVERYLDESYKKTVLAPGCMQTLATLKSKGCELILISSKTLETLTHSLNQLGLVNFFSEVISVSHSGNKSTAISQTKVNMYIGDTQSDMDSASQAGIQSVYFDYFSELEIVNYDHRISNFSELISLVDVAKLIN